MEKKRNIAGLPANLIRRTSAILVGVMIALASHGAWAAAPLQNETQIAQPEASIASEIGSFNGDIDLEATSSTLDSASGMFGVEFTTFNILTLLVMILVLGLIGYSLIASGKKGWGWVTLLAALTVAIWMGRMCTAIFREMAGGHCPTDWDEG